jgi:hypothetical protein
MYFVPEGQYDRSLARSAWESVQRENRAVGYGMIHSEFRRSKHRIGAHACADQTVPYGTALLGGAVPGTSKVLALS